MKIEAVQRREKNVHNKPYFDSIKCFKDILGEESDIVISNLPFGHFIFFTNVGMGLDKLCRYYPSNFMLTLTSSLVLALGSFK